MFRFVSRLMLDLLVIICLVSVAEAQQTELPDRDREPTPVCATPANLHSGERQSTERTDVPPLLHQPASRRTSNSPNGNQPPIGPSRSSQSPIFQPTLNSSKIQQPGAMPKPSVPAMEPETLHFENWQNFPKPQQNIGCEPTITRDCLEMNFGDSDPCHNPCPLPQNGSMPFQGPVIGLDACGPVHPLPAAPVQRSPFELEELSVPIDLDQLPEMEQSPNRANHDDPVSSSMPWVRPENSDPVQTQKPNELLQWEPPGSDDLSRELPAFTDQCLDDEPLPENEQLMDDEHWPGDEQTQSQKSRLDEEQPQVEADFQFDNAAFRMFSQQLPHDSDTSKKESTARDSASGIVIHPPMIQPYQKNQHTFVVENQGPADAKDLVIEITVPDDVRILATLPPESANTTHQAVFKFEHLQSGDRIPIHVTAISSSKTPIPFEANVTSRSVYSFDVHRRGNSGVLKNASYNRHAVSIINQANAQLIPAEDTFTDPVLVRNPHYQTLTRDQKASLPANLR